MPFRTAPPRHADGGLEGYSERMPKPLVVAILDGHEEREGRTTAIVTRGFVYAHPKSKAQIEVPEGYVTDFASIPAIARAVFPSFGRHAKAAVLHDWLYLVGEPGQRAFADRIFLDAMEELGVGLLRRRAMHTAVRLGGAGAFAREHESWSTSFADWITGDRKPPPVDRERCYRSFWINPPNPHYTP